MNSHSAVACVGAASEAVSLTRSMKSFAQRVKMWGAACADYYEAASLYEELRHLSDAELRKRGFSRDSIARDVCASCDRATYR